MARAVQRERDARACARTYTLVRLHGVHIWPSYQSIVSPLSPRESLTPTLCVQFLAACIPRHPRRRPASFATLWQPVRASIVMGKHARGALHNWPARIPLADAFHPCSLSRRHCRRAIVRVIVSFFQRVVVSFDDWIEGHRFGLAFATSDYACGVQSLGENERKEYWSDWLLYIYIYI